MKTLYRSLFTTILLFLICTLNAQNLKVMPDGVILPKADHTAVVLAEEGQMVYDTVTNSFWYFNTIAGWTEVGADNLGNHSATATLDMANHLIENVSTPVNEMDAANKAYVDQDTDPDSSNELQTISASVEGDTMYLSDGNWLIVPGLSDANYIKDFNGNVYTELDMDGQIWLKENMRATHYNDGTPIPKIESASEWIEWENSWNGTEYTDVYDAYSWFDNDSTTYAKFGILYNWGVVDNVINGGKNVCPVGYEVPTDSQLMDLMVYVGSFPPGGGIGTAGVTIKLPPGDYWNNSLSFPFGAKGTNASGFSAVGSGLRSGTNGAFIENKEENWLWSVTGGVDKTVHAYQIHFNDSEVDDFDNRSGGDGSSIRCVKAD